MKNEGTIDRIIRALLALIFFVAGSLLVDGWARLALYALSLAMVVTATTGFCWAYKLIGIDTTKK